MTITSIADLSREVPEAEAEANVGLRAGMMLAQSRKAEAGAYAVVPEGAELVSLHDYTALAKAPQRTQRFVTLYDDKSLVGYVKRFAQSSTVVFADPEAFRFTAVVDYDTREYPEHGVHRATYNCPLSDDWQAWMAINGRWLTQLELAQFVEEHARAVIKPDGADLMELARELTIDRERKFHGGVKSLQNGLISLRYDETDKASVRGGAMEIPSLIVIRVPVFYRGVPIEQAFFLRYKLDNNTVKFRLDAHRLRETKDAAFQVAMDAIAVELPSVPGDDGETTAPVPVYRGQAPA
jgi:hypothetical protein